MAKEGTIALKFIGDVAGVVRAATQVQTAMGGVAKSVAAVNAADSGRGAAGGGGAGGAVVGGGKLGDGSSKIERLMGLSGNAFFGIYMLQMAIMGVVTAAGEWEQIMAGVSKTTYLTGEALDTLGANITEMGKVMGISRAELAEITRVAGMLGIQGVDNLTAFTKAMGMLAGATDMAADEGAMMVTRFMNLTNVDKVEKEFLRISSAIVELGNNFAATESEITWMATVISQATAAFGLSAEQILSMSALFASSGLEPTSTATALNKFFTGISRGAREGSEALRVMAAVIGQTEEATQELAKSDLEGLFNALLNNLGAYTQASQIDMLAVLGLPDIRTMKAVLTGAKRNYDQDTLNRARGRVESQTYNAEALHKEHERARKTMLGDFRSMGQEVGDAFMHISRDLTGFLVPTVKILVEAFEVLAAVTGKVSDFFEFIGASEGLKVLLGMVGIQQDLEYKRANPLTQLALDNQKDVFARDAAQRDVDLWRQRQLDHRREMPTRTRADGVVEPDTESVRWDQWNRRNNMLTENRKTAEIERDKYQERIAAYQSEEASKARVEMKEAEEVKKVLPVKLTGIEDEFSFKRSQIYEKYFPTPAGPTSEMIGSAEGAPGMQRYVNKPAPPPAPEMSDAERARREQLMDAELALSRRRESIALATQRMEGLVINKAMPDPAAVKEKRDYQRYIKEQEEVLTQEEKGFVLLQRRIAKDREREGILRGMVNVEEEINQKRLQVLKTTTALTGKGTEEENYRRQELRHMEMQVLGAQENVLLIEQQIAMASTKTEQERRHLAVLHSVLDLRQQERDEAEAALDATTKRLTIERLLANVVPPTVQDPDQAAPAYKLNFSQTAPPWVEVAKDMKELTQRVEDADASMRDFYRTQAESFEVTQAVAGAAVHAWRDMAGEAKEAAEEIKQAWRGVADSISDAIVDPMRELFNGGSFTDAYTYALERVKAQLIEITLVEPLLKEVRTTVDGILDVEGQDQHPGGFFGGLFGKLLGNPPPVEHTPEQQAQMAQDAAYTTTKETLIKMGQSPGAAELQANRAGKEAYDRVKLDIIIDEATESASQRVKEGMQGASDNTAQIVTESVANAIRDSNGTLAETVGARVEDGARKGVAEGLSGVSIPGNTDVAPPPPPEGVRTRLDNIAAGYREELVGPPAPTRVPVATRGTNPFSPRPDNVGSQGFFPTQPQEPLFTPDRPLRLPDGTMTSGGIIAPETLANRGGGLFGDWWLGENFGNQQPGQTRGPFGGGSWPIGGGNIGTGGIGDLFGGGMLGGGISVLLDVLVGKAAGVDFTTMLASNLFGGAGGGMRGLLSDPITSIIKSMFIGIDMEQMLTMNLFDNLGGGIGNMLGNFMGNSTMGSLAGGLLSGYASKEVLGLDKNQAIKKTIFDALTNLPTTSGPIVPGDADPGLNGGIIPETQGGGILNTLFGGGQGQGGGGIFSWLGNLFGGGGGDEGAGGIGQIFTGFLDGLGGVFDGALGGFGGIFDGLLGSFGGMFDGLGGMFGGLMNGLGGLFGGGGLGGLLGGGGGLLGGLGSLFGGGMGMMGGAMGGIASMAMSALGPVGMIAGSLFSLFEEGGHITKGGYAVVGEAGPEIVKLPQGAEVFPSGTMPVELARGNKLPGGVAVPAFMADNKVEGLASLSKVYGLETGGKVTAPGLALVGEKGAEVVKLPGADGFPADLMPAQGLADTVNAQNTSINLNVNGVQDPGVVRAEVQNMIPLIERVVKNQLITDIRSPTSFAKAIGGR